MPGTAAASARAAANDVSAPSAAPTAASRTPSDTTSHAQEYIGGAPGKPAADEAQRKRRIVSIDVTGTAAMAKIELDYPDALLTDYMALLKVDGEWKIVDKIFDRQVRTPASPSAAAR